jgi:hypothetical protein
MTLTGHKVTAIEQHILDTNAEKGSNPPMREW